MGSMEDYRSKSYGDGRMELEVYRATPATSGHPPDFRSYSTPHGLAKPNNNNSNNNNKRKTQTSSSSSSSSSSASAKGGAWYLSDPELQRKKRVAGYKAYTVEGKVKGSFRKSFRWLKDRYTQVLNGWR